MNLLDPIKVFKGIAPLLTGGSERIANSIQLIFPETQIGFWDLDDNPF
jgi:hypothetical protein